MKEICVPLPRMPEVTHAEVEVKVEGRSQTFNFRVESFDWQSGEEGVEHSVALQIKNARIDRLRQSIQGYDRNWELVQIYNPAPAARHIQVLFRQRM